MVSLKDFAKTFLPFANLDKKNVHFSFGPPTFEKHMLNYIINSQSNLKKNRNYLWDSINFFPSNSLPFELNADVL